MRNILPLEAQQFAAAQTGEQERHNSGGNPGVIARHDIAENSLHFIQSIGFPRRFSNFRHPQMPGGVLIAQTVIHGFRKQGVDHNAHFIHVGLGSSLAETVIKRLELYRLNIRKRDLFQIVRNQSGQQFQLVVRRSFDGAQLIRGHPEGNPLTKRHRFGEILHEVCPSFYVSHNKNIPQGELITF